MSETTPHIPQAPPAESMSLYGPGVGEDISGLLAPEAHTEIESPFADQAEQLLTKSYEGFKAAEQREALPTDPILVKIAVGSVEYQALLEHGVKEEDVRSGTFTRQELLDAGYRFINTLGGGEKGIINGEIKDPDTGEIVDFTSRTLLTEAELDMAYRAQLAQPELYGLQGQNVDEVRKDMMSFLLEATAEKPFGSNRQFMADLYFHIDRLKQYGEWSGSDVAAFDAFIQKKTTSIMAQHPELNMYRARQAVLEELVKNECADLYEWVDDDRVQSGAFNIKQTRGVATASLMEVRAGSLSGQQSPFLESGFYFRGNLDANIFTGSIADLRSPDQLRMNVATLHLAGAHPKYIGFSEMGNEGNDQSYMPTGYYVANFYSRNPADRRRVQRSEVTAVEASQKREVLNKAAERLLQASKNERAASGLRRVKRWLGSR